MTVSARRFANLHLSKGSAPATRVRGQVAKFRDLFLSKLGIHALNYIPTFCLSLTLPVQAEPCGRRILFVDF